MALPSRHSPWGLLATLLLLEACASSSARTWEDGAALGQRPPAESATRTRLSMPADEVEVLGQPIENAAEPIEVQLLRFAARRRAVIKACGAPTQGWPAPAVSLLRDLFDDLFVALDPKAERRPTKRALIQARVVPEAEIELLSQRFGPPPEALQNALADLKVTVAWHMRELALRDRGVEPHGALVGEVLTWPLQPVLLTSSFGYRKDPIHGEVRFHSGVDLGAQRGELVFASSRGVVVEAGWSGGYGRRVVIKHQEGLSTVYAHLDGILVVEGVQVELGSPLGFVGSSGRSTAPHLHFEVWQMGQALDPLDAIGRVISDPSLVSSVLPAH